MAIDRRKALDVIEMAVDQVIRAERTMVTDTIRAMAAAGSDPMVTMVLNSLILTLKDRWTEADM